MSPGLERVREVARKDKKARFTALLHHVTADALTRSFYALKRHPDRPGGHHTMDGPDPPTRSLKAPVTRVFEATRLADELIAAAYDRLLAAAEPIGAAKPASRPSSRRTTVTVPTPTGGRGQ